MPDRVILCIGTKKGLFVAEAAQARNEFALRGPFGPGVAVYATLIDARSSPRVYASSCNAFFGMKVLVSADLGNTFQETKSPPAFPKDDGRALANIWSLEAGDDERALVRRRASRAFPQQRRRRLVGDGRGHQQPRARSAMAAGKRRALHAHDRARGVACTWASPPAATT